MHLRHKLVFFFSCNKNSSMFSSITKADQGRTVNRIYFYTDIEVDLI